MSYKWDESLETGHEKIDTQHKQLIETLNSLIAASQEGKDKEEIFKVVDFLLEYTILHFKAEEVLQLQYNYPDYYVHKKYHEEFKVTATELNKQLIETGPTPEMINYVTNIIGEWFIHHIKGDDFRMAAFIKSVDAKAMRAESK